MIDSATIKSYSSYNSFTALFLQDFFFVPQVHKSVQCTFAVLQGQPVVFTVVLRLHALLQRHGVACERKQETKINNLHAFTDIKCNTLFEKKVVSLTAFDSLSTVALSISINSKNRHVNCLRVINAREKNDGFV